ncbi:MAG: hypothetical protein KC561_12065, partial [Myxococcales bacterium]|nr:hypothetical protein [Myxococcales bacterium]
MAASPKRHLAKALARARRLRRKARAWIRKPAAQIVFHVDYQSPPNEFMDSHRGQRIIDYLVENGLLSPRHWIRPRPATFEQLNLVHSFDYLEQLDAKEGLWRIFGEHNSGFDAVGALHQQRWMTGGTIAAAREAVKERPVGRPVVNLGGGLHHAHADKGGGSCTVNDVAVAIALLRRGGFS